MLKTLDLQFKAAQAHVYKKIYSDLCIAYNEIRLLRAIAGVSIRNLR